MLLASNSKVVVAKSIEVGVILFVDTLTRLDLDCLVIFRDRFESLFSEHGHGGGNVIAIDRKSRFKYSFAGTTCIVFRISR